MVEGSETCPYIAKILSMELELAVQNLTFEIRTLTLHMALREDVRAGERQNVLGEYIAGVNGLLNKHGLVIVEDIISSTDVSNPLHITLAVKPPSDMMYYANLQFIIKQIRDNWFYIEETRALHRSVERDMLTGLCSRQKGQTTLHEQLRLLEESSIDSMTVVFIDLDNFKRLNDTYGHFLGDSVLESVGRILNVHTSGRGHAVRWGGEELLLILPDIQLEELLNILTGIRKELRREVFSASTTNSGHTNGTSLSGVTCSVGVATARKGVSLPDADNLVSIADTAMYQAKQGGKDQVVFYNGVDLSSGGGEYHVLIPPEQERCVAI